MSHHNKLFLFICAIWLGTNTDIVQSKFIYRSDAQRWIEQNKIVATWEEAKQHCDKAGAILASPINEQLLKYIKSYIEVNGHNNPYFIGMELKSEPEPQYVSIEGIQLENMPKAVFDMIDKLDPHDGKCLSMNRDSIRVVPCWSRLPYICYTGVTTNGTDSNEPVQAERITQAVKTPRQAIVITGPPLHPMVKFESRGFEVPTPVENVTTETYETTDAVEIASTSPAPDCNMEDYVYYPETGRCYRLNYIDVSWANANSTCYDEGGYLVILNDENEAKVVTELLAKEKVYLRASWVGLRDDTGKGEWRSIHGEALSELFNKIHEPTGLLTKRTTNKIFCAILLDEGALFESDCEDHYSYICEKDAIF